MVGVFLEAETRPCEIKINWQEMFARVSNLHHSSRQHQISDPLSEVRDQTLILMDTSRIHFHCVTMGTPSIRVLNLPTPPTPQSRA